MSGTAFTLAIFKPHLLKNPIAYAAVEKLINASGMEIVRRRKVHLTQSEAERFYGDHKGKFFYGRLISLMTSGPLEVLVLSGENIITRWRELMGPTKVFKAVYSHPDCTRSLCGLSDTRNATHGSDSESSFLAEAALFFPNQKFPSADNCPDPDGGDDSHQWPNKTS